ncbi:MAG: transposase, partial [Candidatus Thorarchaeota archaeon]|nr:transposase [Candidatus Thorarchaeota archaeon]
MILTYKVKHNHDFSEELRKAQRIAEIAVENSPRWMSSKEVKHIGLKSVIANQVLRKYGRNKTIKRVRRVKLTLPNQGIKLDQDERKIRIPSLKVEFEYRFPNGFEKVNQIEIDNEYFYIAVTVIEKELSVPESFIGVDLNTTGHVAVVANPRTGKTIKLGKKAEHIHKKYREIRRRLQRQGKYREVKRIKDRESRIVRELNHQISRKIVDTAFEENNGIRLEDLSGIRDTVKTRKSFRYSLHSWSFYQLKLMIEYKAKLLGIKVEHVNPAYTSKTCSRCGSLGTRQGKKFECPDCGHVDHADVNAAFNIAEPSESIGRLQAERDVCKGSTDTQRRNGDEMPPTLEPHDFSRGSMSVLERIGYLAQLLETYILNGGT